MLNVAEELKQGFYVREPDLDARVLLYIMWFSSWLSVRYVILLIPSFVLCSTTHILYFQFDSSSSSFWFIIIAFRC